MIKDIDLTLTPQEAFEERTIKKKAASKCGLSDEQICICTAVQRKSGDLVVKSENCARPSTEDVVDIYTGHKKGTLFLTDGTERISEAVTICTASSRTATTTTAVWLPST